MSVLSLLNRLDPSSPFPSSYFSHLLSPILLLHPLLPPPSSLLPSSSSLLLPSFFSSSFPPSLSPPLSNHPPPALPSLLPPPDRFYIEPSELKKKAAVLSYTLHSKRKSRHALALEILTDEFLEKNKNQEKLILLAIIFQLGRAEGKDFEEEGEEKEDEEEIGRMARRIARRRGVEGLMEEDGMGIALGRRVNYKTNGNREIGLYGKENFNLKPLTYRINEESFFFKIGKDNIQDGAFGAFKHVGEQGNSPFGFTFALPPIKNSVFLDGVNSLNYVHKKENNFLTSKKIPIERKHQNYYYSEKKSELSRTRNTIYSNNLWESNEKKDNSFTCILSKNSTKYFQKSFLEATELNLNFERIILSDIIFFKEAVNLLLGISNIFGEFDSKYNRFIFKPFEFYLNDGSGLNSILNILVKQGEIMFKIQKGIESKSKIVKKPGVNLFFELIEEHIDKYKLLLLKQLDKRDDSKIKLLELSHNNDFSFLISLLQDSYIPKNEIELIDKLHKIERTLTSNGLTMHILKKMIFHFGDKIWKIAFTGKENEILNEIDETIKMNEVLEKEENLNEKTFEKLKINIKNNNKNDYNTIDPFLLAHIHRIKQCKENMRILLENHKESYDVCYNDWKFNGILEDQGEITEYERKLNSYFWRKNDDLKEIANRIEMEKLEIEADNLKKKISILKKIKQDQTERQNIINLEILAKQIKQTQLREDYISQIEIKNINKKYEDLFEKQKEKDLLLENELEFRKKQVEEKRRLEQQHSDILNNEKTEINNDLNIEEDQKMVIEENYNEKIPELVINNNNNMEEELLEKKEQEEIKEQQSELPANDLPQNLKKGLDFKDSHKNDNLENGDESETENNPISFSNLQDNKIIEINQNALQEKEEKELMEIENLNQFIKSEYIEKKKEDFKLIKTNRKVPLTIILQISFYKPIEMQKELTDKAVVQLLLQKYEFLTVLKFFKRTLLCEQGEKIDNFLSALFRGNFNLDFVGLYDINRIFEEKEGILKSYEPEFIFQGSKKNASFMSFSLNEYGVLVFKNAPKLIREVFNDEACKKYLQIFSFLIKFRQLTKIITSLWKTRLSTKSSILQNKILFFLTRFQNYLYYFAIEKSYQNFTQNLNKCTDLRSLQLKHHHFLDSLIKKTWLSVKGKLAEVLKRLVGISVEFAGKMMLGIVEDGEMAMKFDEALEFFGKVLDNVQEYGIK